MKLNGAVVFDGETCNPLGVVRSLGRSGIRTVVMGTAPGHAWNSRYAKKKFICPDWHADEREFVDFLVEWGSENHGYVLFPTEDTVSLVISKHRKKLEEYLIIPLPDYQLLDSVINKKKLYQKATKLGLDIPKTSFPHSIEEVVSITEDIGFPVIVKPFYSNLFQRELGQRFFVYTSMTELKKEIERFEPFVDQFLIQEVIPGRKLYVLYTFLDEKQRVLALCGWDKVRQTFINWGTGTLCRSKFREKPISMGISILKKLGFYGFAAPEFKLDRDGKYKLIEINARVLLQSIFSYSCGNSIELAAYKHASGKENFENLNFVEGVLWINEVSDLKSSFSLLKSRELSFFDWIKSYSGKRVYGYWSAEDPVPFSRLVARNARRLIRNM